MKNDRQHNGQKDNLWSTKHCIENYRSSNTNTTKNRGWTQAFWGWVSSSCSTSGIHHVTLVTNPVISHEWGTNIFKHSIAVWNVYQIIIFSFLENRCTTEEQVSRLFQHMDQILLSYIIHQGYHLIERLKQTICSS